ncbi:unnamed protein product [Scytosiphon promiscuus]
MAAARTDGVLVDTTLSLSLSTFVRLVRSEEFYRSTRARAKLSKQEVVELGNWVPWEFQSEDQDAPSNSEDPEEVVPSPPPADDAAVDSGGKETSPDGENGNPKATVDGTQEVEKAKPAGVQGEPKQQEMADSAQQMYRKIRLRTEVSSPLGATRNDGVQGQTLREGKDEVIYTETDCVSGLPMFRGDLAVKTTYRVTRSEDDPDNSVRVKVNVVVRDVKLARALGWLSKGVQKATKDSGRKQAENTLKQMVDVASSPVL